MWSYLTQKMISSQLSLQRIRLNARWCALISTLKTIVCKSKDTESVKTMECVSSANYITWRSERWAFYQLKITCVLCICNRYRMYQITFCRATVFNSRTSNQIRCKSLIYHSIYSLSHYNVNKKLTLLHYSLIWKHSLSELRYQVYNFI